MRLFVKVHTSAIGVKKALTWVPFFIVLEVDTDKYCRKTSTYFICTSCQSFYEQPLGRVTEKKHEASGNINYNFRTHPGPVVSDRCPECESALHVSGFFIYVIIVISHLGM